jgi:oligopeptide/dipeptide ABC transporter ATP-binding protein
MIFISHDIGVIGYMSHRVAVMYMGRVVEMGDTRAILDHPHHPYTRALMAAVPRPDPALRIEGAMPASEPPSQFSRASGCVFAPRCPLVSDRCRSEAPLLRPLGAVTVACHNIETSRVSG